MKLTHGAPAPSMKHRDHASVPVLERTDWIPCTTPPVRDGDYELEYIGKLPSLGDPVWRGEFKRGKFFSCEYGDEMDEITRNPQDFRWRGVRRWVLVRRRSPGLPDGNLINTYLVDARPRGAKWSHLLLKARPFRDKADAERFAARYKRLGLVAVLP